MLGLITRRRMMNTSYMTYMRRLHSPVLISMFNFLYFIVLLFVFSSLFSESIRTCY